MVYAVGAGGIFASQFHLLSHSVFKALLFLGAGAVIHSVGTRDMLHMGGLGKKMPVVRFVFVIGALALAGIPILNGFWSKELILEAGLQHGNPLSLYILMLVVAGLTAFYTFRMVWMVFYGESTSERHVHDAGTAMKVALIPLAIGSFLTWLLAGPFGRLLAESLPSHIIKVESTLAVVQEVITAPATLIALLVIALGAAGWIWRRQLTPLGKSFKGLVNAASNSFGFETVNRSIVTGVQKTAEALRVSQPGLLNWNMFAVITGLAVIVIVLIIGA